MSTAPTTHDPGPWKVRHYGNHTVIENDRHIICDMNADPIHADIAVGNTAGATNKAAILAADATLIALSPELLQLAQAAAAHFAGTAAPLGQQAAALVMRARARQQEPNRRKHC